MALRGFLFTLLIAMLALGGPVQAAAERYFPADAKRGDLKAFGYPQMKIGDRVYRLAPGGKVYNPLNMIVMPDSSQMKVGPVMYTVDFNGHLSAIWLLTAEEAALHPLPDTKKTPDPAKK
jgi:hypothetical protein